MTKIIHEINTFADYLDKQLNTVIGPFYQFLWIMVYVVYFVLFLGVWYISPSYVTYVTGFIQTFIALVLIIRFNPLRGEIELQKYDRSIIFASGMFMLLNAGLTGGFVHHLENKVIGQLATPM
jgi:hypothetical protein